MIMFLAGFGLGEAGSELGLQDDWVVPGDTQQLTWHGGHLLHHYHNLHHCQRNSSMEVITVIIMTIINIIIIIIVVTVKDIDFKKLKATMEAAKQAEDQIQKTGEMAYNQVASLAKDDDASDSDFQLSDCELPRERTNG